MHLVLVANICSIQNLALAKAALGNFFHLTLPASFRGDPTAVGPFHPESMPGKCDNNYILLG